MIDINTAIDLASLLIGVIAIFITISRTNNTERQKLSKAASDAVFWIVLFGYLWLFTREALSNEPISRYVIAKMIVFASVALFLMLLKTLGKFLEIMTMQNQAIREQTNIIKLTASARNSDTRDNQGDELLEQD